MALSITTDSLSATLEGMSIVNPHIPTGSEEADPRDAVHYPTRLSDIGEDDMDDNVQDDKDYISKENEDPTSTFGSWQVVSEAGDKIETLRETKDLEKEDGLSEADCKAFFKAAISGDIAVLQEKLALGVDVDRFTNKGFTALVIAIMEMRVEAVDFLLQRGADPNRRVLNLPPMVHALTRERSSTEIMQLLVNSGACLNSVSGDRKNALHWAASEGKPEAVEFLISKCMDIEKTCRNGRNPLVLAAEFGHTDCAKILLQHGAKLDVRSGNGGTPLMWSATNDHLETVKLWLEHGVDIDATDHHGLSALFLASHFGSLRTLRMLLDSGADASILSKEPPNFSPVMAAACTGHAAVIEALVAHGCDLTIKNNAGENALDLAFAERKTEAIRALLKAMGGPESGRDSVSLQLAMTTNFAAMKALTSVTELMYSHIRCPNLEGPDFAWMRWALNDGGDLVKPYAMRKMLHAALEDQDVKWMEALASKGCDVSALLESGHTPLTFSIGHRNLAMVQALLDAGADPNKACVDGFGALDYALNRMKSCEDTTVVDLLLKTSRCRINVGRNPTDTAFSYVLNKLDDWGSEGQALAMRMIDSVEDVNEDRDSAGATLLHAAVFREQAYFVDLLLLSGADLEAVDNCGVTSLIQACQHSPKMIPILVKHGANVHVKYKANAGALAAAAAHGNVESLEILLDYGLDIEAQTEKGYSALACALTWGQEDAALFLMEKGADVHWKTRNKNQTALHFAAKHELETVVEELLNRAVEVNTMDDEGWTPLHEACATGNTNIVRMILEAGADIEAELPNTDRPLHVALINEQRDMAKLLIVKGANINVRASRSRTPLHLAAEYAVFEAALMLLDKGASTEDVDEETWTPLCCSGHPDMVELLISRGANVDYADKDNWTPLHQAVSNKDYHTAVQLVRAGASVDVRTTDDGLTVMERAKDLNDRRESDRFVELLEREIFWRETRKDSKAEKSKEPECDVVELGGDYVEVSAQGPSIEVGDA